MRQRSLISLACATVVLVVLAIVTLTVGDRGVSRAAPNVRAFPALAGKLGDVASVTVERQGSTMTFIRDGDSWLVSEKGNYPANAGKISQIVRAMADLTLVEPKTQKAELYPRLELEDPASQETKGERPWSRSRTNLGRRLRKRLSASGAMIGSAAAMTGFICGSPATRRPDSPSARWILQGTRLVGSIGGSSTALNRR